MIRPDGKGLVEIPSFHFFCSLAKFSSCPAFSFVFILILLKLSFPSIANILRAFNQILQYNSTIYQHDASPQHSVLHAC